MEGGIARHLHAKDNRRRYSLLAMYLELFLSERRGGRYGNKSHIPRWPLPQHICKTVFPRSSLASAKASLPKVSTKALRSSRSPNRAERMASSICSSVGFPPDMVILLYRKVVEKLKS